MGSVSKAAIILNSCAHQYDSSSPHSFPCSCVQPCINNRDWWWRHSVSPSIYKWRYWFDNWRGNPKCLEQYSSTLPVFRYFFWHCDPMRAMAFSFTRFLDHTQRRTTVGRTPLDEWSARRRERDLYPTTHNNHNRQTSMPLCGIRTRNPRKRAAADPRFRPRCHRGRSVPLCAS